MAVEKEVVPVPGLVSYAQYGFSQAVRAGDLVFVTGQAGVDAEGNVVGADIETQAAQALANLERALEAAGTGLGGIVAMTSDIVDIATNGPGYWEVRKRVLPDDRYTSASIGVAALANPALLLEIQSTAVLTYTTTPGAP